MDNELLKTFSEHFTNHKTFPFFEVNTCISWKQLIMWLSEEQTKEKIKKKKTNERTTKVSGLHLFA